MYNNVVLGREILSYLLLDQLIVSMFNKIMGTTESTVIVIWPHTYAYHERETPRFRNINNAMQ